MRLRLTIVLLVLALQFPASRSAYAQDPAVVDFILTNINIARVANGLPPYALNSQLTQAAQVHSEDMAQQAYALFNQGQSPLGAIVHEGSDGTRSADRVAATGYNAIQVGENIYGGIFGEGAALDFWLNSSPHLANLLHERYSEVGIGLAPGPEGLVMYTVVFAHSNNSPLPPAPTSVPQPAAPLPEPTAVATATATQSPTPAPTATVRQIQLPRPVATVATEELLATSDDSTTDDGSLFARPVTLWVILLEAAAIIVGLYTVIKLLR